MSSKSYIDLDALSMRRVSRMSWSWDDGGFVGRSWTFSWEPYPGNSRQVVDAWNMLNTSTRTDKDTPGIKNDNKEKGSGEQNKKTH